MPVAQVTGRRAEKRVLELRPGRLHDGLRAVHVVPGPAAGQAAQGEAGEVDRPEGIRGAACRELPDPSRPAHQHVQGAVHIDDLDEQGRAQLIQQFRDLHGWASRIGAPRGPQRAAAHHLLQPPLFPLQRGRPHALALRLLQLAGDLAERGQAGAKLRVGRRPHRRDRQGGGPPPFTPGEQQPRPVRVRGMALGQHGQFGAMRGGLGPQLRGPQGEPVLVQDLKTAAAGGEQAARIARRLGPQRFGEPAAGPRHGRAAPPGACRGAEMTIGIVPAAQVQRYPPGQQMRQCGLGRAELLQPGGGLVCCAEQPGRHLPRPVAGPDEHEPGVSLPPGALLRPEQAVGSLGPVQGCLRLPCGQRAGGRHQQQFGFLGRPAMRLLDIPDGRVRLGQCLTGQPGCQQHVAAVEAEEGRGHVQRPVPGGRFIQERQRGGQVS